MKDFDPRPDFAFNILALDPGSETLGYGLLQVHAETFEIVNADAWTIYGSKLPNINDWNVSLYHERFARIQAHKENLLKTLEIYDPLYIACESPFYNPRRPGAYGVLMEVLCAVKDTVYTWNKRREVYLVDPATAKKGLGVSGKSGDKDLVKNAIANLPCLKGLEMDGLDEHSSDALAVGYYRYNQLKTHRKED